jgi:hypothetical protein
MKSSLSKSDKKLIVRVPGTPKIMLDNKLEKPPRKVYRMSESKKSKVSYHFPENKSNALHALPFPGIGLAKKILPRPKSISKKHPDILLKNKIKEKKKKKTTDSYIFEFRPKTVNKNPTQKTRSLSRRPQHMSFRNICKPEEYKIKSINDSWSVSKYEYSGDMMKGNISFKSRTVRSKPNFKT